MLKKEILDRLNAITPENFMESYSDIVSIIYRFRDKGLNKEDAHKVIIEISQMSHLNDLQEDVIIEMDSRMSGFTNPPNYINW